MNRFIRLGLVTLVLSFGAAVGIRSGVAQADTRCPNQPGYPHVYSTARWCDGTAATNVLTTWNDTAILESDPNDYDSLNIIYDEFGHISDETWILTHNTYYDVYMEAGVLAILNTNTLGLAWWLFWGDTNPSYNGGKGYVHLFQTVNLFDGATHYVQFWYSCCNGSTWNVRSDLTNNLAFGTSIHQVGVYSWAWQTGLEEFDGDVGGTYNDYSADTTDPDEWTGGTFNNQLQVYNGSSWHYPNDLDPDGRELNNACGTPGYCLNGTSYGAGEWSDNIPG